jgi:hypothetical protein
MNWEIFLLNINIIVMNGEHLEEVYLKKDLF